MTKKLSYKKEDYDPSEWDESRSITVIPEKRQKSSLSTSIRLPRGMVTKLRRIALKKGDIGYQSLIKIWLAERLDEEEMKRSDKKVRLR